MTQRIENNKFIPQPVYRQVSIDDLITGSDEGLTFPPEAAYQLTSRANNDVVSHDFLEIFHSYSDTIFLGEQEGQEGITPKTTGKTILPVFVTSGKFSEDALRYLTNKNNSKKMQSKLKHNFPSQIYYDRESLLNYFGNQRKFTEHKKVLKKFFKKEK